MSDLLALIERVGGHEPQPFTVPIPEAERITVMSLQDGIPYRFRVRDPVRGWWLAEVIRRRGWVRLSNPAQPADVMAYLEALPRFYVVALFRLEEQTWLCIPWSAADAAQRGWPNGEPRVLHLVRHSVRAFDALSARSLAGLMLYEDVATRLPGAATDATAMREGLPLGECQARPVVYYNALAIIVQRNEELRCQAEEAERDRRQQAVAAARQQRLVSIEEHIRWQLGFVGAQLVGWDEAGEGLSVRWEYDGYQHEATVSRALEGVSAGICMEGSEVQHNLSSLVLAIQEARRLHRFDLAESAWL